MANTHAQIRVKFQMIKTRLTNPIQIQIQIFHGTTTLTLAPQLDLYMYSNSGFPRAIYPKLGFLFHLLLTFWFSSIMRCLGSWRNIILFLN